MHNVTRTIRRIAPAELPTVRDMETGGQRAATEQDLLNMGMVPLGGDLYSCTEQRHRCPECFKWYDSHAPLPGAVIAEGTLRARHEKLPPDVKARVMRASVFRATAPGEFSARAQARNNLLEAEMMLREYVGEGVTIATSEVEEARRLAVMPENSIAPVLVPEIEVSAEEDVVERTGIIPHSWAGERQA